MPASPVLADSSFYIRCLRARQDPLRALALAAESGDVAICGVVRCEVGRALRPPELRRHFRDCWDVMINVPTDNRVWTEVEETLWNLDRQGVTLPLTDVVIACCAKRIGAVVLTYDHHFDMIPDLRITDRIDL